MILSESGILHQTKFAKMKFSIITPVFNGEEYIARTIESIISEEGEFEIEYIIQDGGSTDNTKQIVFSYIKKLDDLSYTIKCASVKILWDSEKDGNLYIGANRGFRRATGDIYVQINSDDVFVRGAFQTIASVMKKFSEIEWLAGISEIINKDNEVTRHGRCLMFNKKWIEKGVYGRNSYFIPHNAVFWRSSLWKKAGPYNEKYKLAGDYALWIKFSQHTKLWSLNSIVSSFRRTPGQLSENIALYKSEQHMILPQTKFSNFFIRAFFSAQSRLNPHFQNFFLWLYRIIFLEKGAEYIEIENGVPIKKPAYSFITNK